MEHFNHLKMTQDREEQPVVMDLKENQALAVNCWDSILCGTC